MANVVSWLYGVATVGSFCILVWLTWYAWQHRSQPIARSLTVFTFTLSIYSAAIIFITFGDNPDIGYLAARVRMVAASVVYLWFLAVILDYSGGNGAQFLRRHWYLFIIPAITSIISLSSKVDEWLFSDWAITPHGPINLETLHYRGFYFIHVTQYYLAVFVVLALLVRLVLRRQSLHRRHAIANIVVVLIAFLSGTQRNLEILTDVPNLFPIGLFLVAVVLAWGIFSFQLFNLLPVAYGTIFEHMHDAAVVVDQHYRVVDLNPAASKLIPPPTALGRPLSAVMPDLAALLDAPDTAHEITLNDGDQPRYYEARVATLYQMKQHTVGHLVMLTDITKRKLAEREREQLIVALDAYAHTVAHDLKNPIALVLGYASLLHDELASDHEQLQSYTSHIMEASQKNVQIINELLLFASVRRRQDISIVPLNMHPILDTVLRRLQPNADYPHAQITIQPNLPQTMGYAAWVEEVWVNLLGNALKYGGTPPQVEIGGAMVPGRVRYWVRDNGNGLTTEEARQLLSQEGRLKKHAGHKGHGFGLAIVRSIVERLGGSVGIESEVGKGSLFYFTLPAAETPTPAPVDGPD